MRCLSTLQNAVLLAAAILLLPPLSSARHLTAQGASDSGSESLEAPRRARRVFSGKRPVIAGRNDESSWDRVSADGKKVVPRESQRSVGEHIRIQDSQTWPLYHPLKLDMILHEARDTCRSANVSINGRLLPPEGHGEILLDWGRSFVASWDLQCLDPPPPDDSATKGDSEDWFKILSFHLERVDGVPVPLDHPAGFSFLFAPSDGPASYRCNSSKKRGCVDDSAPDHHFFFHQAYAPDQEWPRARALDKAARLVIRMIEETHWNLWLASFRREVACHTRRANDFYKSQHQQLGSKRPKQWRGCDGLVCVLKNAALAPWRLYKQRKYWVGLISSRVTTRLFEDLEWAIPSFDNLEESQPLPEAHAHSATKNNLNTSYWHRPVPPFSTPNRESLGGSCSGRYYYTSLADVERGKQELRKVAVSLENSSAGIANLTSDTIPEPRHYLIKTLRAAMLLFLIFLKGALWMLELLDYFPGIVGDLLYLVIAYKLVDVIVPRVYYRFWARRRGGGSNNNKKRNNPPEQKKQQPQEQDVPGVAQEEQESARDQPSSPPSPNNNKPGSREEALAKIEDHMKKWNQHQDEIERRQDLLKEEAKEIVRLKATLEEMDIAGPTAKKDREAMLEEMMAEAKAMVEE